MTMHETGTVPRPPGARPESSGARSALGRWLRENLFSPWYNTLLTAGCLWFLVVVGRAAYLWAFHEAEWAVVPANLRLFLVGTYPPGQLWRVWLVLMTIAVMSGLSAGAFGGGSLRFAASLTAAGVLTALLPFTAAVRGRILLAVLLLIVSFGVARGRRSLRPWLACAWLLSFPWTLLLLWGVDGAAALPRVETSSWGGLLLTLLLAVAGIVASFPLGVLLALGRRSRLPAISWVSAAYIELVRGTPLVAVLFMAHLMLPIFMPDFRVDRVVRAMVGFTAFTAAYMAENVRGGLQGVPRGQYEAAEALGMNRTLTMLLIILPQAIRSVVPSIVGQFISLFKDTSLVAIIGLLDLLGVARSVIANPAWLGLQPEVFAFAAALYWIFSFSLSRASARVERALGLRGG